MAHLPSLIYDLALILLVGSLAALIFKIIRQPLVLGYILAGFLVGQHFEFLPSVSDLENVDTLAELGVIFLLFSLGLEFSFKKLVRVGPTASITALVEIVLIGIAGFLVGRLLGWSSMDSLFMGGMLASSSTTIILRAFDELGLKTKEFARIVFGVLVVEDILVILLMVLLSTIAVTRHFEGVEILYTVLKLGFFMVIWFLMGIYLLPTFFKKAKKWLDDETTLLLGIGLCLGMVIIATKVGFSAELGAFVMGSLIAETTKAEKIEHLTKPIKELFGTIFFVSVGMMIDPQAMVKYALPILAITFLVIIGKMVFSAFGMLLSGQSLHRSVQVGMSMAQIGEFAFIVATLGLSLGVISEFLFPIAVGVSAITTFTTPYLIRASDPFYEFLKRVLPKRLLQRIETYSSGTAQASADPEWKKILKSQIRFILLNVIILIGILLLFNYIVEPLIRSYVGENPYADFIALLAALAVASPFLWAMMGRKVRATHANTRQLSTHRMPIFGVLAVRFVLVILIIGVYIDLLISTQHALWIILPVVVILLLVFSKWFARIYKRMETRFFDNLTERERSQNASERAEVQAYRRHLETWDAHIVELEVNPLAEYVGRKLYQLGWRERFGINVVYIKRGDAFIELPSAQLPIMPYDKVGIVATDAQLEQFKPVFDQTDSSLSADIDAENIVIRNILLEENNRLIGLSVKNSRLREEAGCLMIGVERDGIRLVNPDASFTLHANDEVWIAGNEEKIRNFFEGVATT